MNTNTPALATFKDLCLDTNDHQRLANWWCAALGYVRRDEVEGETRPEDWPIQIFDPSGEGPAIWIVPVPERKTVKNRMHIDVFGRTQDLLDAGATLLRARDDEIDWDVLADPEGNEFCVFTPREHSE